MDNIEPQGAPAGGSALSSDDQPTGNDGTAGADAPSGDASATQTDDAAGTPSDNKGTETETGITGTEFGEDPDLEVNDG